MPSPHNTRAASETLILTSQDDDLNSFPAEDSPADRTDDVLILPEEHVKYDYALRLFDSEGEPAEGEGILQRLPAPPPKYAVPVALIAAPPPRRRSLQVSVAAAGCVAIAALVIVARLSRPASESPREVPPPQASGEPISLSPPGVWQSQSADVDRVDPPDLQNRATLDRKAAAEARQPPEAAPRTTVSSASRAQTLRIQPADPQARGTAGSVAPGPELRPIPSLARDVAVNTRVTEPIPSPPPIAEAWIPAASIPSAPTPSAPGQAAIVRPAPPVLATPSTSVVGNDESAVRTVLNRYRAAYNDLDAGAARDVWPTVDAKALGRAFERLESQELVFDRCQIAVNGSRATAACGGDARFVPKVGKRTPRVESREWTFDVRKTGAQWTISGVEVR